MLIYFESFEVGERNCRDWSHCVALDKVKTTDCGFVPNGYWQIEWMNLHLFNMATCVWSIFSWERCILHHACSFLARLCAFGSLLENVDTCSTPLMSY